ncbi:MAG: sn-glycerol-3-phosphate ABC transporter ATP-binding protein UgpC [Rhodobacteraceae bacterium]|nr:sn-glycerol-3-phosphate ABC transporter ATP-binding protein UgpC [Paracoccaceae bacterium]MYF46678.1 sn-glycerol-3-phosphate ABC transporter ATP-binding protein UgpC [Paracoccaceae bacterium]MYG10390.1 sn-glycerol-3-phosphate ABC transporter ATP-binding protein UgpC [Paracoccaceae bacterium]MYI92632.1 sn-glycerol-3-phosphate ABC transporter ATP-binding protein UgpC [Paracoccaceae bacterium]MYJ86972.1 sn-glycerol-3-phosphate ABC transporter ATP-binding protein UgpC [Paracoccaceae bacterium]
MGHVSLKSLNKFYGDLEVIPNLDLEIPEGSFTVLVGPSGCGKSTILRLIAGLEEVTKGEILIDGNDVTYLEPSQRKIAMVFQSYALYPHMTVAENIGFGLTLAKLPKNDIRKRVLEAAKILQLEDLLERKPKALSGGQRQRVAIGRAITRNPKVFLFDEPLSNLDASLRGQMRVELTELHSQIKATMIYVTHDQVEAMTMADQIVVLNEGNIEQVGNPMELYEFPQTLFVARFIGSPKMNIFQGKVAAKYQCQTLGVRPEHMEISHDGGILKGSIRHIEKLGADTLIYSQISGYDTVTARIIGKLEMNIGDPINLKFSDNHVHRFNDGIRIDS